MQNKMEETAWFKNISQSTCRKLFVAAKRKGKYFSMLIILEIFMSFHMAYRIVITIIKV